MLTYLGFIFLIYKINNNLYIITSGYKIWPSTQHLTENSFICYYRVHQQLGENK